MSQHHPSPPEGAAPPEEPDGGGLFVALDIESDNPPDVAWLRRMIRRVCGLLEVRVAALNVVVIDDDRMADLHRRYRGAEGTTDVLAFDLTDPPPAASRAGAPENVDEEHSSEMSRDGEGAALDFLGNPGHRSLMVAARLEGSHPCGEALSHPHPIEGEVYICLDEARRRADQLGHPVRHELLLYAVHGLLHLMGYDDHDPEDHHLMHAREDAMLSALGVGPVFLFEGGNHS